MSLYIRKLDAFSEEQDTSYLGANSGLGAARQIVDNMNELSFNPAVTGHTHIHELKPQVKYINTSFDWSPSGKQLVYAVNKHNQYGENYRDLFIHDITSKIDIRLSQSARIESPAWHPQGHGLLAVQQSKGTQNLVWVSLPDSANWNEQVAQAMELNSPEIILDDLKKLTFFEDGQTIFSPVRIPMDNVYGAYAYLGERQISVLTLKKMRFTH